VQAKGDFCGREHRYGHRRQQLLNPGDRIGEAVARSRLIRAMHQASGYVAAIMAIYFGKFILPLIEAEKLPFGNGGIQTADALTNDGLVAWRNKELKALDNTPSILRFAAGMEPQNPKRQRRVNRGLRLVGIHAQHGKGTLALAQ
jgi:hypothetical protein